MSDATSLPDDADTDRIPLPLEVGRILVDAINAANARGIEIIASSDPGVLCISMHARERWIVRPRARGVSPVGAAILFVQPEPPEVEPAGCVALGVEPAWMIGFTAGLSGEPPYQRWEEHPARILITEGYLLGQEIRTFVMTVECPVHRRRHRRGRPCPECGDAIVTPTDLQPSRWARR